MIILGNKVVISDPCYSLEKCFNSMVILENVKDGYWQTFADMAKNAETECGDRVVSLRAIHKDYLLQSISKGFVETDKYFDVDSGQAGIFNYDYFLKHSKEERDSNDEFCFYGRCCKAADFGTDDKYFFAGWGEVEDYGVVSHSGIGDGSYSIQICKIDNQIIGIKLVYLDWIEEQRQKDKHRCMLCPEHFTCSKYLSDRELYSCSKTLEQAQKEFEEKFGGLNNESSCYS